MSRPPSAAPLLILSFAASLVAILALHPVILAHLSTHYLGGSQGDGGLYVWLAHSFHSDPAQALAFETNSLYPYGLTRAWSDSFLLPSALVHLLAIAGLSLPLSYNAVTLAALALNGACVARLARALGASSVWSIAAGAAFANSAYLFGNLGHPQLVYFFWVPLAWSMVISGEITPRRWLLAGVCAAASFYCAVYYAVFAVLGIGLIAALRVLSESLALRQALLGALLVTVGLSPVALALPAYLSVQAAFGERHLYEAAAFAATGLSYLSFSPLDWAWGWTSVLTQPEATLCAGYAVTLAGLAWGIARSWRRATFLCCVNTALIALALIASSIKGHGPLPHIVAGASAWLLLLAAPLMVYRLRTPSTILFALSAVFFVLSLGPGGEQVKDEPMWAPLATFYGLVPGLDAIRAVGRYGAVVVLSLYVAAALWLSSIRSRAGQAFLGALVLLLTVSENSVVAFSFDPPEPAPLAFELLAQRASPRDAAVVLPFADRNEKGEVSWHRLALLNTKYSLWAAPLGITLVNGYSGQRSRLQYDLSESLLSFPSPESVEQLSRVCGLAWVVVVPGLMPGWSETQFMEQLSKLDGSLSVIDRLSDGSLLLALSPSLKVSESSSASVLVPKGRAATISAKVSPLSEQGACTVEVTRLREDGDGEPSTESSGRLTTSLNRNELATISIPASRGSVRPGIFKVAASSGCLASTSCSIQ